jgi:aspartyl-tRNA(Asn)/glutamyl-tRNA(Gln) amidotransferase subunit A
VIDVQTIAEAAKLLAAGELSAKELAEEHLGRITEHNIALNAYLSVDREGAIAAAEESDLRRAEGKSLGPLDGIPISIKDVIVTKGIETTAASKMLEGFVPAYDATVVSRLKAAGAVILGKNNCDAWAHGSSTENSDFGPTKNPWDLDRVPGGSSGGSAAAVAAGLGLASIGTDTGGSIRQPAALTGVTGLKPTYGRLSRHGLIAMASSLDCPGPFTRTAEDAALLLHVMSTVDPMDSTTLPEARFPVIAVGDHDQPLKGLKVGLPAEYFAEGLDATVNSQVQAALKQLEQLGASLIEVSLPTTPFALAAYYVIMPAEVSSNLARYDGIRYGYRADDAKDLADLYLKSRSKGFGTEAKRRIMLGTFVLSHGYYDAYYKQAMQVRTKIIDDFSRVFAEVDILVTPTTPTPAFKFGEKTADPLAMYLEDIYTVSANLAGIPGISIPCGFASVGSSELPVGLQLLGPQLGEEAILRAAMAYQQVTDWHLRQPAGFIQ